MEECLSQLTAYLIFEIKGHLLFQLLVSGSIFQETFFFLFLKIFILKRINVNENIKVLHKNGFTIDQSVKIDLGLKLFSVILLAERLYKYFLL